MTTDFLLGKAVTIANTYVSVATVPTTDNYASITINATNTGSVDATLSIYVSSSATPGSFDIIESNADIIATGVLERTCILVSPGETIFVMGNTDTVVVRCYGILQSNTLDPATSLTVNNINNTLIPALQAKDTDLQTQVTALQTGLANAGVGLASSADLTTETSNRTAADTDLQNQINVITGNDTTFTSELTTLLNTTIPTLQADDTLLQAHVSTLDGEVAALQTSTNLSTVATNLKNLGVSAYIVATVNTALGTNVAVGTSVDMTVAPAGFFYIAATPNIAPAGVWYVVSLISATDNTWLCIRTS